MGWVSKWLRSRIRRILAWFRQDSTAGQEPSYASFRSRNPGCENSICCLSGIYCRRRWSKVPDDKWNIHRWKFCLWSSSPLTVCPAVVKVLVYWAWQPLRPPLIGDLSFKNQWSRNIFVEFYWARSLVFIRSDEGLTLETSAFESLYSGQITLSTQLIKPNYLLILPSTQHHSIITNLPLYSFFSGYQCVELQRLKMFQAHMEKCSLAFSQSPISSLFHSVFSHLPFPSCAIVACFISVFISCSLSFIFFPFLHIRLQMEMQEIHSHLKAAVSSPQLTRTMITGKSTARKRSKAVGGMACVTKPVLMVCTSMAATQIPRILPRESRGTVGLGTSTFWRNQRWRSGHREKASIIQEIVNVDNYDFSCLDTDNHL